MGPTFADLKHAQVILRHLDKALRLRYAIMEPYTIIIERKTFRGRIGALLRGVPYEDQDAGFRAENGHVSVASIRSSFWNTADIRDALMAADSWRRDRPLWQELDERDGDRGQYARARARAKRQDMIRYKTSELFDRYVWRYRQRVSVPVQVS
jgi:hypothetical protein